MEVVPNQKNIVNGIITAGGNVHIGDYLVTYNNYFAAKEVKIPHRLTNNIPTNADHILGRDAELATTKAYLEQNQATVLFNGIGGIGKTSVASKYMASYGSEYKHLAWITVQSTLAEAFTNNAPLLASLHITQQVQGYIEAKQSDKAFEYLFHQLNLLESTLVVIDNANDLADLDQYKNWFDTASCHFLITSRSQPSEWATIEVDSLPEEEAVALFRKLHSSVSADDEAIKNLLSKLFYHTLLIELVAKAGATTGIPFTDLQTMIETQFIHHQSLNEAPIPTGKHGSMVATNLKKAKIEDYIWLIFSQVKGLDEHSKQLLKAMALLPVATPFGLDFLKEHFAFFKISDAVNHLDSLTEGGWLQQEHAEGQKPYFKIHPLIADVVVEHLGVNVEFSERYIWHITNLINYDGLNPEHNIFKINCNKPLSERLCDLFFYKNTEGLSYLLDRLCNIELDFGLYDKAIKNGERALQIAKTIFDENHVIIATRQTNLSLVYNELGQYELAADLVEKSLAIDSKNFDKSDHNIAAHQHNLGKIYRNLGKYQLAIEFLEMALESEIKNFGIEHPQVSVIQSSLGYAYFSLNNFDKAAELFKMALSTDLRNFDSKHPGIAVDQSNLGTAYRKLGKFDDAIIYLESALNSDLNNFGNTHPIIAIRKNNLAWMYKDIGRYDEANALWQAAYEISLKYLGAEHPNTIRFKQQVGM